MSEWQPIETAPKDTSVLVYGYFDSRSFRGSPQMSVSWRRNGIWCGGPSEVPGWTPTAWMPLPAAPALSAKPVGEVIHAE